MTMLAIEDIQVVREGVVRYRIILDSGGSRLVHGGAVKRLGLKTGKYLDANEFENTIRQSEEAEAREFALRSLASRGRTEHELTGILIRKGFTGEEAANTVKWIRDKGLIEVETLLDDTVEALMKRKGIHQVRQILNNRGFSKTESERVLKEKVNDPEHFQQVLSLSKKKMKDLQARYPNQWSQRLATWLYGKGHDRDMIRTVLSALKAPDIDDED